MAWRSSGRVSGMSGDFVEQYNLFYSEQDEQNKSHYQACAVQVPSSRLHLVMMGTAATLLTPSHLFCGTLKKNASTTRMKGGLGSFPFNVTRIGGKTAAAAAEIFVQGRRSDTVRTGILASNEGFGNRRSEAKGETIFLAGPPLSMIGLYVRNVDALLDAYVKRDVPYPYLCTGTPAYFSICHGSEAASVSAPPALLVFGLYAVQNKTSVLGMTSLYMYGKQRHLLHIGNGDFDVIADNFREKGIEFLKSKDSTDMFNL
ncbi:uncharacterized protein EI90DRAFT_3015003 [Cantharellus anzutake]|uniref:uncharacterized protein n=1 Tax=Cantharellus anzutake TaxID=1750568 RepID=UPI001904F0D8|nr:uncharacterized protein EI90DRAFT_3015003 [Cantharellus anzutake]KAF8334772.1 hypothetical protein EI90DRAFT_3015003 [Cantharellus anzutake]